MDGGQAVKNDEGVQYKYLALTTREIILGEERLTTQVFMVSINTVS